MTCVSAALTLLAGALLLAPLVMAGMALARNSRLAADLDKLRAEVRRLSGSPPPAPAPALPAPARREAEAGKAGPLPATGLPADPAPQLAAAPAAPAAPRAAPRAATAPAAAGQPPGGAGVGALEELLGARLLVWVGSIALALAGAFLVKISFERGWISPLVRVALGLAFGLLLLGGGEAMRRSSGRIAQALAAAGIADLFACFLAAVHVYGLIPPTGGFLCMALTTALAVLLSLRQGAMVALIGLIGGFLTPALIQAHQPSARSLFLYLLLLVSGLLAASRRKGWWPLAAAAIGCSMVWAWVWLAGSFQPGDAPWVSLFLLALAAASVAAPAPRGGDRQRVAEPAARAARPPAAWLTWATVAGALATTAVTTGKSGYSGTEWGFFGLLAAGTLVLAWRRGEFLGLAWVAAGAVAALLAGWGADLPAHEAGRFLATLGGLAALFVLSGWAGAALHRERPAAWAALGSAAGIVYFLVAWASARSLVELGWSLPALAIAALYFAAALPLARRGGGAAGDDRAAAALSPFAIAVTAFVGLAVPLGLDRQWLTAGWAVEVAALAAAAAWLRLPVLVTLLRLLALAVAFRLLLNPAVLSYPIASGLVWNWLLCGYGLCIASFVVAAHTIEQQPELPRGARAASELRVAALAFAVALLTLEIHHAFHRARLDDFNLPLREWGMLAAGWLALAWALLRAARLGRPPWTSLLARGGTAMAGLGAGAALLGGCLVANPLWTHQAVGATPIFNSLLWIYGLPLALSVLAAREEGNLLRGFCAISSLLLTFALVTLEVRQAFHGGFLDGLEQLPIGRAMAGPGGGSGAAAALASAGERYTYSAAWVALGLALLLLGIARRGKLPRYGSLAVMLLAVCKVFLYDTARLSDLYRVFSFLGLGVSLLLLAFLYQRFVFSDGRH